jgi:ketosteroid isomerase-like protein
MTGANMLSTFNETEIHNAVSALEKALESPDPTAWVYHYTVDAIFVGPGSPPVQGRQALLQMAGAMKPLSSVSIRVLRSEGSPNLAYTYGEGSWVSGRPPNAGGTTNVRFVIVWRKEADNQWRVALEMLNG